MFLKQMKELGAALLESAEGCSERAFLSYLGVLRFFGYHGLAENINFNTQAHGSKYKCSNGTIQELFKSY